MRVRDIMTTKVVAVGPGAPFRAIAALLHAHRISAVPVVSGDGRVLGIVSEADLIAKGPVATARDLMSAPAITVPEEMDVRDLARVLSMNAVKRVPVLRDGRLVGIASRGDALKLYLRPDHEIREEILERVLPDRLQAYLPALDVEVLDGTVHLDGRVLRRTTAELIERFVERLEGVVHVVNRLAFEIDDGPEAFDGRPAPYQDMSSRS